MNKLATALILAALAVGLTGCLTYDPNREIDYSKVGYPSDDGSR